MPRTLLVIPCYRERARLPLFLPALLEALQGMDVSIRVVDDGSGPEQQDWLRGYIDELRGTWPALETPQINPDNQGKGGAVYSAWDHPEGAERLAFADADGAVPPEEVARLLDQATERSGEAVFAVRTGGNGTLVRRAPHRRVAGWVFRRLVRLLFRFPVPDTQCGCKIIPAAAYAGFRSRLAERRFTFDIELTWQLLHAGVNIISAPVNWSERPGSHLRPASVLAMFRSLCALRRRLGRWRT